MNRILIWLGIVIIMNSFLSLVNKYFLTTIRRVMFVMKCSDYDHSVAYGDKIAAVMIPGKCDRKVYLMVMGGGRAALVGARQLHKFLRLPGWQFPGQFWASAHAFGNVLHLGEEVVDHIVRNHGVVPIFGVAPNHLAYPSRCCQEFSWGFRTQYSNINHRMMNFYAVAIAYCIHPDFRGAQFSQIATSKHFAETICADQGFWVYGIPKFRQLNVRGF